MICFGLFTKTDITSYSKLKKKNKKKTNDEKVNIIPLFYYAISELS